MRKKKEEKVERRESGKKRERDFQNVIQNSFQNQFRTVSEPIQILPP